MRTQTHFLLGIMAITLVVGLGFVRVGRMAARQFSQNPRPSFTIYYQQHLLDTRSGKIVESSYIYAERGDGSTVRVNLGDSGKAAMRLVKLLPNRKKLVISDEIGAVATSQYSNEVIERHLNERHDSTCTTHPQVSLEMQRLMRLVGSERFLGMPVVKYVWELNEQAVESWEAPECNCNPVFQRIRWKDTNGSVTGITEDLATTVTLGEPPAELFELPTSYVETLPSEVIRGTSFKLRGKDVPADMLTRLEWSDKNYQASQTNK